jgi:hypothetical protein
LAVRFTDERKYFVSEASVYRLLKAHDLITSPAYVVIKAANEFKDKTTAINQLWLTDFTYLKITGWGWYYLSTVLDDFSRYIVAWRLGPTMCAPVFGKRRAGLSRHSAGWNHNFTPNPLRASSPLCPGLVFGTHTPVADRTYDAILIDPRKRCKSHRAAKEWKRSYSHLKASGATYPLHRFCQRSQNRFSDHLPASASEAECDAGALISVVALPIIIAIPVVPTIPVVLTVSIVLTVPVIIIVVIAPTISPRAIASPVFITYEPRLLHGRILLTEYRDISEWHCRRGARNKRAGGSQYS